LVTVNCQCGFYFFIVLPSTDRARPVPWSVDLNTDRFERCYLRDAPAQTWRCQDLCFYFIRCGWLVFVRLGCVTSYLDSFPADGVMEFLSRCLLIFVLKVFSGFMKMLFVVPIIAPVG